MLTIENLGGVVTKKTKRFVQFTFDGETLCITRNRIMARVSIINGKPWYSFPQKNIELGFFKTDSIMKQNDIIDQIMATYGIERNK